MQKECRDEALNLVEQLEAFLLLEHCVPQLREKKETRKAVEKMLTLTEEISKYILDHIKDDVIGASA